MAFGIHNSLNFIDTAFEAILIQVFLFSVLGKLTLRHDQFLLSRSYVLRFTCEEIVSTSCFHEREFSRKMLLF